VVYAKRPFGGPEYVLQYLGRYAHRVAISNPPRWEPYAAPKSIGKHKATSREPARTLVSSSPTFVPLLTTEGFRILFPKSFQRERTCLMKLGTFILLLVNKHPGGVSYVRGVEKSATPFDGGI